MDEKIELFSNMEGWEEVKASMTDIPEEDREAVLMSFIDTICGMLI